MPNRRNWKESTYFLRLNDGFPRFGESRKWSKNRRVHSSQTVASSSKQQRLARQGSTRERRSKSGTRTKE